jgi:anti-sigma regulatory factor (Ser/Thr protein kinase)
MRSLLDIRLDGGSDAPQEARDALRPLKKQVGSLSEDVALLVSELVTNAVVHAKADTVWLRVLPMPPDDVRVEVTSPGPLWDLPVKPRPGPVGGFGFFLVQQLARDWGVVKCEKGTQVWFEISPQ